MGGRERTANFTPEQRAEIFARDRALCSYSGRSLWLADFGAVPYSIDWVDHVVPVTQGGRPTLENGACASWLYNWMKRDSKQYVRLFHAGFPTADYSTFHGPLTTELAAHLRRFSVLHPSDWYFNRALYSIVSAASVQGQRRRDGKPFKRGASYGAESCLKYLDFWRTKSKGIPSLRKRGLLPFPMGMDQRLLLSTEHLGTVREAKALIRTLAPMLEASWLVFVTLSCVRTPEEIVELRSIVNQHPELPPRIKRLAKETLVKLPI